MKNKRSTSETRNELTDNARLENPVVPDDFNKLLIGSLPSSIRVDVDAQRLSNADRIG